MVDPIETLVVTFFDIPVLAARSPDGRIFLAIRDLCTSVGLSRESQMRRLRTDPDLSIGLQTFRIETAGGPQPQEFLLLEHVPLWISGVTRRKATPDIQDRLRFLKLFIIGHVHDAIAQAAGLPAGSSRNIEDLRDLERYDTAIQGIAARTEALEESQGKARTAWREHEGRIRRLEEQIRSMLRLSPTQRGTIYEQVHAWGRARADREGIPFGAAIAKCWGTLKARFTVAKYEDIPAAQYEECLRFIRQSYAEETGESLGGDQLQLPGIEP
ncbi:hypothetical protein EKD04_020745 [Chloroflexales bacterium ZM16-3]|nr:hypothetical protein [Chloroflexales bacterium ZM16-3]